MKFWSPCRCWRVAVVCWAEALFHLYWHVPWRVLHHGGAALAGWVVLGVGAVEDVQAAAWGKVWKKQYVACTVVRIAATKRRRNNTIKSSINVSNTKSNNNGNNNGNSKEQQQRQQQRRQQRATTTAIAKCNNKGNNKEQQQRQQQSATTTATTKSTTKSNNYGKTKNNLGKKHKHMWPQIKHTSMPKHPKTQNCRCDVLPSALTVSQ